MSIKYGKEYKYAHANFSSQMTILYNTLVHGISWIIPLIELLNYVFIQSKLLSW